MPLFPKPRITERQILRAMLAGFALVLLLLGAAGLAGVRGTRSIERSASSVVREQLLISRLLNEVQAEQDTLTGVLHRLSRTPQSIDRPSMLRQLDETDRALERAISAAGATPEAGQWRKLGARVASFSALARELLGEPEPSPDGIARLFAIHDEVAGLVHGLLTSSSQRVTEAEDLLETESHRLARESAWLLGTCFALALLCAAVTVAFSRRSIRQMEWQANELSRVSWNMLQSQEVVARRFSHEVHDELGQSLAAVKANLQAANPSEYAARRADCLHLVDEAIANVRELAQLLRPVILDDFGLDAGLRWLTEKFAQRTGLAVTFESTVTGRLADETETHLFRIAQEALTNIARHSGASVVKVGLEERNGSIRLCIEDNGRGLEPQQRQGASLGMTGMRARARQAGGELEISSKSGGGLRIDVTVPAAAATQNVDQEDAHPVS